MKPLLNTYVDPPVDDIEGFCDNLKKSLVEMRKNGAVVVLKMKSFVEEIPVGESYPMEFVHQFIGARYTIEVGQPARESAAKVHAKRMELEWHLNKGKIGELGTVPQPTVVEKKS